MVSIGITVMVPCSGGGRLDLILNIARKNVNFKPRDMVVAMMGGEWSVYPEVPCLLMETRYQFPGTFPD